MHSLWLPGGLAPPCRVISSGRKSLYNRHTASTEAYSVKMAALFSVSLHDGSPLGDSSPSHCACSDTNGLWHKAQHNRACSDNKTVYSIRLNININISGLS